MRKAKKINQQDFAEIMGYSKSHMCALENGRKNFTMESLILAANKLECDVEELTEDVPGISASRIRGDVYKILMDDVSEDSYRTIQEVINMAWCKDHPDENFDKRLKEIKEEMINN